MSEVSPQTQEDMVDRIARDLYSIDPGAPGIAVRMDRIERQIGTMLRVISWIGRGGLLGLAGTIYLLWQLLRAVEQAGGL